jgi:hypothetical protein
MRKVTKNEFGTTVRKTGITPGGRSYDIVKQDGKFGGTDVSDGKTTWSKRPGKSTDNRGTTTNKFKTQETKRGYSYPVNIKKGPTKPVKKK